MVKEVVGIRMKITRSSKCYFNKWLTKSKMSELKDILQEYARICNYFVEKYEKDIPSKKKFDLLRAELTCWKQCTWGSN